jgi:SAM-dependent methyltransferase
VVAASRVQQIDVDDRAPVEVAGKLELFRMFRSERHDPDAFYSKLADRTLATFALPLKGRTVVDLGSGPGHYAAAMERAGAEVLAVDLRPSCVERLVERGLMGLRGDATALPFADGSVDAVFTSNLLEHVPDPYAVLGELERVLKPGGWGWISWTNWYSPWGGHLITPFHYLGPDLGSKVHRKLKGPPARNPVYDGLWPLHIGPVLRHLRDRQGLRIVAAMPRYYPSQRWIMKVPALREVASWNCLIVVERVEER